MTWDFDELRQAQELINRIEDAITPFAPCSALRLSSETAMALSAGLHIPISGRMPLGALAVRHLLYALGFDEHRLFRIRFEHKLIQAAILNHYCAGCIPVTRGLQRFLSERSEGLDEVSLRKVMSRSLLKQALGYGTTPTNGDEAARSALLEVRTPPVGSIAEEEWIVQDRLDIANEYRVHTLEDSVIEDLTYYRHTNRPLRGGENRPNEFVKSVLARLPRQLVYRSLWGWDVAETTDRELRVIEVNLCGYHPVSGRGFQCSGFFQDPAWGPLAIARLARYAEEKYSVRLTFESDAGGSDIDMLYRWIQRWTELLRFSRTIETLVGAVEVGPSGASVPAHYLSAAESYKGILRRFSETASILR